MKYINYGSQTIDSKDIKSVTKVLKSKFITQGNQIPIFEKKINKFFGGKYSVAVSSGTAALHLSMIALNLKKNDVVITTPITFLATATAVINAGCKLFLSDINLVNFTIDAEILEKNLRKLKKKNQNCAAVIAVDYAGSPCDWKKLKKLSKIYNFKLINDNCHAIGSKYLNSCKYAIKYSDIVTHSYHPVKNITTGEGGCVITNNKKIYKKILLMRSHGMFKNKKKLNKIGPWYYNSNTLGFNYRLNDFQAAMGISQLKKINFFLKKRNSIAGIYSKNFKDCRKITLKQELEKNNFCSYHLFTILFDFKKNKISKKSFFEKMKKDKINLQVHYIPLNHMDIIKKNLLNLKSKQSNSEYFYKNTFSIPIYPDLSISDQKYVIKKIKKHLKIFSDKKKINIAIIPAREGSKRIKKKNIKKFISKPIILFVIKELRKSKFFDLIVVTSDSPKILQIAKKGGAHILIKRPKNLSDDKTDTKSVIKHSIRELDKNFLLEKIFCTYPTSVFLNSKLIKSAFDLEKESNGFILGASNYNHPIQRSFKKKKNNLIKLNYPNQISKRTQDLEKNYHDAGQFYLASRKNWMAPSSIISNKTSFIELSKFESQDIDNPEDWEFAETLFKKLKITK